MSRNTVNYWIDLALFVLTLVCFVSGIVIWCWHKPKNMGQPAPVAVSAVAAPLADSGSGSGSGFGSDSGSGSASDSDSSLERRRDREGRAEGAEGFSRGEGRPEGAERRSRGEGGEARSGRDPGEERVADGREHGVHGAVAEGNAERNAPSSQARGGSGTPQKTFLGLTRRQWKWLHIWPSVVVLGPFLAIHLWMHASWFFKTTAHIFSRKRNANESKA